ncbi:MAG: ribonuclease activity regulator RraA [Parafilimonas terrae]|nr:ribonuclease activity regulator RraA [Parafilimonas terrae]
MRVAPAREDLATPASWSSPISTRAAIEAMPEGCVAVIDAMRVKEVGIFGDLLRADEEAQRRGAGDGRRRARSRRRPRDGSAGLGRRRGSPVSVAGLTFVAWQEPIGCGGIAISPHDLIAADKDGVVVIPKAIIEEIVPLAVEQERLEGWIMNADEGGAAPPGLDPPNEDTGGAMS